MLASGNYLVLDALFSLLLGALCFFQPSWVAPYILTGETEGVQWHLIRCVGAQMLGISYAWWMVGRNNNKEAHSTCFMTRITHVALMLVVIVHTKAHFAANFQNIWLPLMTACVLCLVTNITQLLKNGWPMGQKMYNDQLLANGLVHFDSFAALIIGCVWICFPDWVLQRQVVVELTGAHIFLGRCMGAFFVATQTLSAQCLYWQSDSDRRGWAYGRAIMCFGILCAQIWSQIAYHDWWTGRHWVGISLFSIWSVLVFIYGSNVKSGKFK